MVAEGTLLLKRALSDASTTPSGRNQIIGRAERLRNTTIVRRRTITAHARCVAVEKWRIDRVIDISVIVHVRLVAGIAALFAKSGFVRPDKVPVAGEQVRLEDIQVSLENLAERIR